MQVVGCASVLHLAQALLRKPVEARLWVVTSGAQAIAPGQKRSVVQAPVLGLCRALNMEHPELRCGSLDLDAAGPVDAAAVLQAIAGADAEDQLALRGASIYAARLVRANVDEHARKSQPVRLETSEKGVLDNLALRPSARRAPAAGEIEIQVTAAGLNFRDVLNALGMYPGDPGPIGNECVGTVVAVGEGVTAFKPGDEVMALGAGTFGSFVTTPAALAAAKPSHLSSEEAATIPIAFLTSDYALSHVARMRKGERVLIHAAAGGVGLAAVQLALQAGCEIFATAGSDHKRSLLRSMGVQHVMDSRSLGFSEEILRVTGGRGVDIVLNSLTGEFIPASMAALAKDGRFLELGRIGIWTSEHAASVRPDVSYTVIDFNTVSADETTKVLRAVVQKFTSGGLSPLPLKTFAIEEAADAFRYMAQARHVGKIVLQIRQEKPAAAIKADRTYLITGGYGGLGLLFARWMAERGASHIALLGRRHPGADASAAIQEIRDRGVEVRVLTGDVAKAADVARVLSEIAAMMPPLSGVVHAAGSLQDAALVRQTWDRFEGVFAPKISGAWHLDRQTQHLALDFFVLFSSTAALFGNRGQANYAAANAFLDALAADRRARGLSALSINWGPWSGVGMAAALEKTGRGEWDEAGIGALSAEQGLAAFERVLASDRAHLAVLRVQWQRFLRAFAGNEPPLLAGFRPARPSAARSEAAARADLLVRLDQAVETDRERVVHEFVTAQALKVLGLDPSFSLEPHQGLRDVGLDSLMAVELRNRLQRGSGLSLPATLAFDCPTVEALTARLVEKLGAARSTTPAAPVVRAPREAATSDREPIAIVGMGCRFPGGATSPDAFWQLLRQGFDGTREIPADRWDIDEYFDANPDASGKMYTRRGAFLDRVDLFDPQFFGISPREAVSLDPQQRLLLEVSWEALENAGQAPDRLLGSPTGVFVGISSNEYSWLQRGKDGPDVYAGTGNALSAAAGRLSYVLGLQGPSLSVDTACSSSLVALHLACQSLRLGECRMALAGGVNVMLLPDITVNFCRARMMSADGRCKTFDAAADGYVRGEGCGVVILKKLSDAIADGDRVLAIVAGSATNQDGRSSGLTVPNGPAQEALLASAYKSAGISPLDVAYVEAHGTGTSLGDPIEVQSVAAVLGAGRDPQRPLILGSVKTNIGHLEAAAGISGLIKAVLALQHGEIPPHLNFSTPNPNIPWSELPVTVATTSTPWPESSRRIAGVSSFGFTGTNAHVVLEAAPDREAPASAAEDRPIHLLALSARSQSALVEVARAYAAFDSSASLADVCFTANSGRTHFAHRIAVVASSAGELHDRLAKFAADGSAPGVVGGVVDRARPPKVAFRFTTDAGQLVELWRSWGVEPAAVIGPDSGPLPAGDYLVVDLGKCLNWQGLLDELSILYIKGVPVDWAAFDRDYFRRKVALPTYPFERQPYWVEIERPASKGSTRPSRTDWLYDFDWKPIDDIARPEWPAPSDIASLVRPSFAELYGQHDVKGYERLIAPLDKLCSAIVLRAIAELGWDLRREPQISVDALQKRGTTQSAHARLMRRMLSMLAEDGILEPRGEFWQVKQLPDRFDDPQTTASAMLEEFPSYSAEIGLTSRCGSRLAAVLRGEASAVEVLFPDGSFRELEQIYENAPAGRVFNEAVRRSVAAAIEKLPRGRKIRALEIGGGTGGTTASVLASLAGRSAEFVFTDLSAAFFKKAQEKFAAYDFVDYRTLDISDDPASQGFDDHSFDMIVAANVLHATPDLSRTLRHVHQMLAPGGLLVLLETTIPTRFVDLTFGLTHEWWGFTDTDLRPAHALLTSAKWTAVLQSAGFADPAALTGVGAEDSALAVILSRAQETATPSIKPGHWVILGDQQGFADQLAEVMKLEGERPVVVRKGSGFDGDSLTVDPTKPEDYRRAFEAIAAREIGPCRGVVHLWSLDEQLSVDAGPSEVDAAEERGCGSALYLTQVLASGVVRPAPRLVLVTRGAQPVASSAPIAVAQASLWGLGRVIVREHPELQCVRIDLDPSTKSTEAQARSLYARAAAQTPVEDQVALRDTEWFGLRLVESRSRSLAPASFTLRSDATYLITGGLQGLGLLTAQRLVAHGAKHLVLMGRSAPGAESLSAIAEIERGGVAVRVAQADVADKAALAAVIASIDEATPLRGIVHSAGALDDGVMLRQTWDRFRTVFSAKVLGTWNLDTLTRECPLDFFVLFSTSSAMLGSAGQANHAAANAFMDAVAHERRARGVCALTINWGAWSELGAAARRDTVQRAKTIGLDAIDPESGIELFERLLGGDAAQVGVLPIRWSDFPTRGSNGRVLPLLEAFADRQETSRTVSTPVATSARPAPLAVVDGSLADQLKNLPPNQQWAHLAAHVRDVVGAVLRFDPSQRIDPQQGFRDLGIDSLMALELRNRVEKSVGQPVPATIAFDCPNLDALTKYLGREVFAIAEPREQAAASVRPVREARRRDRSMSDPIAIIGLGCRYPGGANDPDTFWSMLHEGVDATTEVPASRWNVDAFYDSDPEAPGKMITKRGGFIDGIDAFDPQFFGISPREALGMDPQQRLLLEVTWEALEHAGQAADRMAGSRTAVFVGAGEGEYGQMIARGNVAASLQAYLGTGNSTSVASGRLSYVLGLHGPSVTINTACSSSLVAVHLACQSLRGDDCDMAVAGGVNVMLTPASTIVLSKARMLSPEGRCKTFSAEADGFARSEGCGIVVLKRLSDAQADGDRVLAVIRGTALNQDGRSSGITVPNGNAQEAVIREALSRSGVEPADVDYVEAHGTGTSLGDPIEVKALASALSRERSARHPLRIGSVKTNIGHTEIAAGVAGLIKVVLSLQHEEIPAHLHFDRPSPHIAWDSMPIVVPTRSTPWTQGERRRIAGVSSFGFSGTNAHVIVEEAPSRDAETSSNDRPLHLLALSAKTEEGLVEVTERMAGRLAADPGVSIADFCFTANAGRSHFAHRQAITAKDFQSLSSALTELAGGKTPMSARTGEADAPELQKVAFVFGGELDPERPFGRELFETQPVFRSALERCADILAGQIDEPLLDALYPVRSRESKMSARTLEAATCAVQYAFSEMWRAWGIRPAAVSGRGAGEYIAACVAGAISLEDALRQAVSSNGNAAPKIDLASLTGESIAACRATLEILPVSRAGQDEWTAVLDSLASLYILGVPIDWAGFDGGYSRNKIALPTYPFQRQRYWIDPPAEAGSDDREPLYQVDWVARANSLIEAPAQMPAFVVFSDGSERAEELVVELRTRGGRVVVSSVDEASSIEGAWQKASEVLAGAPATVVYARGLDAGAAALDLHQTAVAECTRLLTLVQVLVRASVAGTRLCLVTRGAQPLTDTEPLALSQAPLIGMMRVLLAEHPELAPVCIDCDPQSETDSLRDVVDELLHGAAAEHVGFRNGQRLVARLAPVAQLQAPAVIREDAWYLITGGLGALGLVVAQWLVDRGARSVVLTGRSAPSEAAQRVIKDLQRAGSQVRTVRADVAREEDVRRLLDEIARDLPPLKGIVHSAGVLDDGVMMQQSEDRLAGVMAPKVAGAWNLHTLTRELPLDFFVCFSSVAAIFGSPGQSNYAAANVFLDALAHERRRLGLPALSINWGPWSEGGMAATVADANRQRWGRSGIAPITPTAGPALARSGDGLVARTGPGGYSGLAPVPSRYGQRVASHLGVEGNASRRDRTSRTGAASRFEAADRRNETEPAPRRARKRPQGCRSRDFRSRCFREARSETGLPRTWYGFADGGRAAQPLAARARRGAVRRRSPSIIRRSKRWPRIWPTRCWRCHRSTMPRSPSRRRQKTRQQVVWISSRRSRISRRGNRSTPVGSVRGGGRAG